MKIDSVDAMVKLTFKIVWGVVGNMRLLIMALHSPIDRNGGITHCDKKGMRCCSFAGKTCVENDWHWN